MEASEGTAGAQPTGSYTRQPAPGACAPLGCLAVADNRHAWAGLAPVVPLFPAAHQRLAVLGPLRRCKAARAAEIWHLPDAAAAGLRRVWYLTAIACPARRRPWTWRWTTTPATRCSTSGPAGCAPAAASRSAPPLRSPATPPSSCGASPGSSRSAMPPCCWASRRAGSASCEAGRQDEATATLAQLSPPYANGRCDQTGSLKRDLP